MNGASKINIITNNISASSRETNLKNVGMINIAKKQMVHILTNNVPVRTLIGLHNL